MIELKNITKVFQKNGEIFVKALDNVNLKISQGEFVAIVGPSGSGKTTLMNILGLLDKADSGDYIIDQKKIIDLSIDEMASIRNSKIGFVFQSFHLLPKTSAKENVELPLLYSDKEFLGDPAFEALNEVGLADRIKHYPSELSGGQQQRVAIARALVTKPEIILADEPTGNLDSIATEEIMQIFKELNEEGKTIILITHEQEIADCADRVIKIVDGKIVSDTTQNLFNKKDQQIENIATA